MTLATAQLIAAGVACPAAAILAVVLARPGRALGLVDAPGERKLQLAPVPLIGGTAILLATILGFGTPLHEVKHDLVARIVLFEVFFLCFLIGFLDDLSGKRMHAGAKAIATLVVLAHAAMQIGGAATWLLLPVAFVLLHAFNTIDHENGVATLVAVPAFAGFALAAPALALVTEGLLAAALAGALVGFLFLNFPRGRVFLGDSGTLLLGGTLAAFLLEQKRPELLLLAAVPMADLLAVAWIRGRLGVKPWIGDRRHVTHRLMARGMTAERAALALCGLQTAFSLIAFWCLTRPPMAPTAGMGLSMGAILVLALGMLWAAPLRP